MGTMANTEDPDEMPLNASFHEGHCFLRQNQSSEKERHYYLEIITCTSQHIKWTILT